MKSVKRYILDGLISVYSITFNYLHELNLILRHNLGKTRFFKNFINTWLYSAQAHNGGGY